MLLNIIIPTIIMSLSILASEYIYSILYTYQYRFSIKRYLLYIVLSLVQFVLISNKTIKLIYNVFIIAIPALILNKKEKKINSIIAFIINYIIITGLDLIINSFSFYLNGLLSIDIIIMLNSILLDVLMCILANIKYVKKFLINIYSIMTYNVIVTLFSAIILFILYYSTYYQLLNNLEVKSKTIIIILLIVNMIFYLYILNITRRNRELQNYSNYLLNNTLGNNEEYKKLRIEKHNINNFLLTLKTIPPTKVSHEIDRYLKKHNNKSNYNIPTGISGFIYNKIGDEISRVSIYTEDDINDIDLSNKKYYSELCNTLGIAIENALSASKNCKNNKVYIGIINNKNELEINITNYFNNLLIIDRLGTYLYTTKKDGNGIGLYSLRNNKYIKNKISIIGNKFYFIINVKNK